MKRARDGSRVAPAFRRWIGGGMLALLLALTLGSGSVAAGNQALVVTDLSVAPLALAGARIRAVLVARGFSVDLLAAPPADLGPYCCAWEIRNSTPLTASERAGYLAMVKAGHGLLLAGEHPLCCRDRNVSIGTFITVDAGGGPMGIDDPTRMLGSTVEEVNPAHPIRDTPNAIAEVTWDGDAAGVFLHTGNGSWLTARTARPTTAAAVWDEGTLTTAPAGRAVVTLDVNWLIESFAETDNEAFLDNLAAFLCPQDASAFTVDLAAPGPFDLECPAALTVAGQVDGLLGDCAVPLRALPRVVSVVVSVDGGPPLAVSNTSPPLPAEVPVAFVAGPFGLAPGAHGIVIVAEDDLGNRAAASLSGLVRDSLPPILDPAGCADASVDLDGACRAAYVTLPVATDSCDSTVGITAVPALPLVFSAPGTQRVEFEARDDAGNRATCALEVSALDASAPVLVCAAPATIECSAPGGTPASHPAVLAFLGATTASDNCALDTLGHDAPAFFDSGCMPGRLSTVTWTATDRSLNSASCSSDLRIVDSTPPGFTSTPGPLLLECAEPGGVPASDPAVVTWLAQFQGSDVCAPSIAGSHDAPAWFPAGCSPGRGTTVTSTLTDDCGNEATAAAVVTVTDTRPPALVVPAPLTLECSAAGGVPGADPAVQAWLALAAASDQCGTATLAAAVPALLPSGCGPGATTSATFTATDACGLATSLASSITVKDTRAPALTVPGALILECNGPGGIGAGDPAVATWLASAAATDTCGGTTLTSNAPALFPSGCGPGATTTVLFTATDDCGNLVSASSTLTVRDTTAPSLLAPAPLGLECSVAGGVPRTHPAVAAWLGLAAASDVCDGASIVDDAPALLPAGCAPGLATYVTFTASDDCGNASSRGSTVTVVDSTAPVLIAPPPLTLECSAAGGIPRSDPAIAAWLLAFASSDDCGTVVVTDDAPLLFPSGCAPGTTTTVTFTAVDGCGNATTRTSTVTVKDTTHPALVVPPALTLECNGPSGIPRSDPAIAAWLASVSAVDVCDSVTVTSNAPAFFPSGCGAGTVTRVVFTAVDRCGNATSGTATVTVRDTTSPVLDVPLPIALECSSRGGNPRTDAEIVAWLAAARASDICDGAAIGHDAPALFPSGCAPGAATKVTFSASDDCGNATSKVSSITVVDGTPPAVGAIAFDSRCLWPPNHDFYCVEDLAIEIVAEDLCDPDPPVAVVVSCSSSEPEDGTGDGRFLPDCIVLPGGRGFCVRSERDGSEPEGRLYSIGIEVADSCANTTARTATLRVPHDRSPHESCRRPRHGRHP